MTILDTSGQHICMFIAWSTIESFDHFENSDCLENVFARNINWNLLSFAVFLNGCLFLYQFCDVQLHVLKDIVILVMVAVCGAVIQTTV
jgi:magnesium-transporting ATPase (P-type)